VDTLTVYSIIQDEGWWLLVDERGEEQGAYRGLEAAQAAAARRLTAEVRAQSFPGNLLAWAKRLAAPLGFPMGAVAGFLDRVVARSAAGGQRDLPAAA
jgi:hypothetical protein